MKTRFVFLLFFAAAAVFSNTVFKSDYTKNLSVFRPIGGIEPKLENGKLFLEKGTQLSIRVPAPGRYKINAKISGISRVQMSVFGGPKPTVMQADDNEISLEYFENGKSLNLSIYTLNKTPFFLDSFTVESIAPPALEEAEIEARGFETEDFPGVNGWTRNDASARNKSYRTGRNWYRPVMGLPVPQTSKPLYIYLRARRNGNSPAIIYLTTTNRQVIASAGVQSTAFEWIKTGPLQAKFLSSTISMELSAPAKTDIDIDGIVWSTRPDLSSKVLDKVKSENPNDTLVSAFPVSDIKIDGLANDFAWKNVMSVTPFRNNGSQESATEQTRVKLGYDTENLYFFFHAIESALEPTNQRLHEFVKKLQKPNLQKCYDDDVVFLLIQRKGVSGMREFVINANGVVTAATCAGPDYWRTRKTAVVSGIRSAGTVGNGYYNVELSIPFSALGGLPKGDDDFRILLGRIEKSRDESSAFSAGKGSFHITENLVSLRFATRSGNIEISEMPAFNSGINKFRFSGGNALFINVLESAGKKEIFISKNGTFNISRNGEFLFTCGLYDPVTLAPLMRFSPLSVRTRSSLIEFQSLPGTEVKINNVKASSKAPLSNGINKIAVSGKNAGNMKFKIGQNEIAVDSTWKYENGVYHKLLLLEHSRLWPDWTNAGVTIMGGEIQQILFAPLPPENMKAADLEFHVEIPEGFQFEGASGYYKLKPLSVRENGSVQYNGKKYHRYSIRFKKELAWNKKLPGYEYVLFVIRAPETKKNMEEKFYFHTSSKSLSVSEIPNECKVHVLPAVKTATPKKVHINLWTVFLHRLDDSGLMKKILEGIKNSGYNEVQVKNEQGLAHFTGFSFADWNLPMKPFLKLVPGRELIRFRSGKPDPKFACPGAINTDTFAKWLESVFPEWFERQGKPKIITLDYEAGIYDSTIACCCAKCLDQFTKQYNLPGNLTTTEIREKYEKEWCDFMTSNAANLAKQIYTAAKKIAPESQFFIYSGYESELTKTRYGVDWKKVMPYMDFGGAGYGRPQKAVEETVKACSPKPVIMGVIAYPDNVASSQIIPTFLSAAELMCNLGNSTGGLLIFQYSSLDGRSFAPQAEVSRIIAENEQFFAPGEFRDAKNEVSVSGCEYFARSDKKGNQILVLTNLSRSKVVSRFSFRKKGTLINCKTGNTTQDKQVTLSPGEIAVYRLDI